MASTSHAVGMSYSGKPKTILIADDEPGITDAVTELLREVGYVVRVAADGNALGEFKDGYPDLILLDIRMSGFNGRDICRRLKSADETCSIPIIMFSASRDTAKIAREAGADDFITKPFEMNELLEKIERYI